MFKGWVIGPLKADLQKRKSRFTLHFARVSFALVLAALLAFQAYLIQSDIHLYSDTASATQLTHRGDLGIPCPLCQANMLAGVYVAPTSADWSPPALSYLVQLTVASLLASLFALSFHWQGRAPPRLFSAY